MGKSFSARSYEWQSRNSEKRWRRWGDQPRIEVFDEPQVVEHNQLEVRGSAMECETDSPLGFVKEVAPSSDAGYVGRRRQPKNRRRRYDRHKSIGLDFAGWYFAIEPQTDAAVCSLRKFPLSSTR